tara:strand:+ start:112 stop:558 length:447 start_codon:yes stop_codon:yes gene_type:complete
MFHQFVDKIEHPLGEMAVEEEFEQLVESKGASNSGLSLDALVVVNGTLSSTCVIESETHTLKQVRGILFDEDRPVFSSTASWLLGKNFSEMSPEALAVLDFLDGEREWSDVVLSWGQEKELYGEKAHEAIDPIVSMLLTEGFIRIQDR